MGGQLPEADRCDATPCATTSGTVSRACCLAGRAQSGSPGGDNRLFIEAVLYRYRAGIPWRDLPERFGDWKNVHRRHTRWAETGVWEAIFRHLASDADNEYAMIDSTIVRAHQHSAGAKKPARTRRSDVPVELTRFGGAFQAFDGGSIDAEDTICLRP